MISRKLLCTSLDCIVPMQVDPFKAADTSETEKESGGGGDLPVKEKLTFTAPERKSRLGMDLRDL